MVTVTIDGIQVTVAEQATIMEAAESVGVRIPGCAFSRASTRFPPAGCVWWRLRGANA